MIVSSASALLAGRLDILPLLVRQLRVQQQGRHADDAVHRRADFMAHVRQEFGFRDGGFLRFWFRATSVALLSISCCWLSRSAR